MKAFRNFIATLLILIIIGGLGYVGYFYYYLNGMGSMGGHSGPPDPQASQQSVAATQTPAQNNAEQNPVTLNTIAATNRETLTEAIGLINQAIDSITIDPYSRTTVPSENNGNMQMDGMSGMNGQSSQGMGTINVYPNGNSSVNISPSGNATPNTQTPQTNNTNNTGNMPGMTDMAGMSGMGNMQQSQNNYVFDQGKLEQLHNGIFALAQGVMTINQLNDDLFAQSTIVEANPANYQTYIVRYNTALQNKNNLSSAINLLSHASTLINVNPYASQNGYTYDTEAMNKMHQGVYKLAQGMALLNKLSQDFSNQMIHSAAQVQSLSSGTNQQMMASQGAINIPGVFGNMNISTIITIILVILLVALIVGVLGAISSMLRPRNREKKEIVIKPQTEPDTQ